MGMLVDGKWTDDDGLSRGSGGKFDHLPTFFRSSIEAEGISRFNAEPDRYHLYVTKTCPWAHRAILFRHLKGLTGVVGLQVGRHGEQGYRFDATGPHKVPGTDAQITYLHELYSLAEPSYTGRVTVPSLWDSKEKTIVNNESSEIIRMLNGEFNAFASNKYDYYPEALRQEIDTINDLVYDSVNNGVYKAGFSSNQTAYNEAYDALFEAFEIIEERLSKQRYLCGSVITEADWRLFPTLYRFDSIYHYAFKCNKKHLYQYPNMWSYARALYQEPGVAEWCFLKEAKTGYWSNPKINPLGTIPEGPDLDFDQAHDRDRFN